MFSQTFDQSSQNIGVCAICQMGYVHLIRPPPQASKKKSGGGRLAGLRLECQLKDCLNVSFPENGYIDHEQIQVQALMNLLRMSVKIHQGCEKALNVDVVGDYEGDNPKVFNFMITCQNCDFVDITLIE